MLEKNIAGAPAKQINTNLIWYITIGVVLIIISLMLVMIASNHTQPQVGFRNQAFIISIILLLSIAIIINTYYAVKRTQAMQRRAIAAEQSLALSMQNAKLGQERLIAESFISAITQLGHEKVETRTGAIYALERVAQDFPQEHSKIMEILTAFVRENALVPLDKKQPKQEDGTAKDGFKLREKTRRQSSTDFHLQSEPPRLRTDIQAALTVIGRCNAQPDRENKRLDLRHTDIRRADLSGAKLQRIDLRGADLSGADLRESDLQEANLDGAKLAGAILYEANLYKISLRGANLSWVNLNRANLCGANLRAANLFGASLRSTNLQGASLYKVNLQQATLKGANLSSSKLFLANLKGAKLGKANLHSAGLIGANLQGANLNGANLQGANLNAAKLQQTDMYFADLSFASLTEADLYQANLMGANLSGTTLDEADLSWANLMGANLSGAQLCDVKLSGAILTGAKNLESQQILMALGDRTTHLPDYIEAPINWRQSG
jgi:uncharacterized protein YjbI with pentapeptide repeats